MGRRGHRRAGPGAVTRRRVVAPVALELSAQDSDRLLTSAPRPHPRPLTPEGTRGAGRGRACAAREGGGAGGEDVRHALFLQDASSGKAKASGQSRCGTRVPTLISFPGTA